MAESKLGDILVRLNFYSDGDALDFQKTGRAVLVVEDGAAELALPTGPKGEQGDRGPAGSPLRPDVVLDEASDGDALEKLKARSVGWRASGRKYDGYFAINKQTKSGFFYTRGGWVIIRDIFGGGSEITPGEFNLPTKLNFVSSIPATPQGGIVLFAHDGRLKMKNDNGEVKVLG